MKIIKQFLVAMLCMVSSYAWSGISVNVPDENGQLTCVAECTPKIALESNPAAGSNDENLPPDNEISLDGYGNCYKWNDPLGALKCSANNFKIGTRENIGCGKGVADVVGKEIKGVADFVIFIATVKESELMDLLKTAITLSTDENARAELGAGLSAQLNAEITAFNEAAYAFHNTSPNDKNMGAIAEHYGYVSCRISAFMAINIATFTKAVTKVPTLMRGAGKALNGLKSASASVRGGGRAMAGANGAFLPKNTATKAPNVVSHKPKRGGGGTSVSETTPKVRGTTGKPFFATAKEAATAAEKLGYWVVDGVTSHNEKVYTNGILFISRDKGGHRGATQYIRNQQGDIIKEIHHPGAWKVAKTAKKLDTVNTRLGTYGPDLTFKVSD